MNFPIEPARVHQVLDAAAGYDPVTNLLAAGDPDVRFIDDQWVMYLGAAFTKDDGSPAGVNLFTARLPRGADLSSDAWTIDTEPDDPTRARPLLDVPGPGHFDEWMHTPCRVRGTRPGSEEPVDLLFYTGTSGLEDDPSTRAMAIGVLERQGDQWHRTGTPIITGDTQRPTVLEPKVIHADGRWRMWYMATHHEAGAGEVPDCEIHYVESLDGVTGWTDPVTVFAASSDNWFDAAVSALPDGRYHLLAARAPNMFGRVEGLPPQGLWSLVSPSPHGDREAWSTTPVQLLDADTGAPWYSGGTYGPCAVPDVVDGQDVLQVFFTGSAPPEPQPYVLSVGRFTVPIYQL